MEIYLKLVSICILGGLFALIVKKHSPEISILICIATVLLAIWSAMDILTHLKSKFQTTELFSYLPRESFVPLVKCMAVSVITQIACGICKDVGQSAVAYSLEFAGGIVLVLCMIPLIDSLFQLLGGLL